MLGERKANIKIGGDFDPIPMDKYTVQIADVNYKTQRNNFKGIEEERLNFQFIVLDDKPVSGDEGAPSTRGRYLWHAVTPSLGQKSWLLKIAKAVYGRDLTKEEMLGFDPESIIGKQVDVVVEQNTGKDGVTVYNNIASYAKNTKPLPTVEAKRQEQETVERATEPAIPRAELRNTGVASIDDPFLDELEGKEEKEPGKETKKEVATEEEDEEDPEVLEAKLKIARAKKAAKAKAVK